MPHASPNNIAGVVNWELPPDGWFKLNVDVDVDATRGLFGFGTVVHNHESKKRWCSEFTNAVIWMMLIFVRMRSFDLACDSLVRLVYFCC